MARKRSRTRTHSGPYALCQVCGHEAPVRYGGEQLRRHDMDGNLIPWFRLSPESLCLGSRTALESEPSNIAFIN